MKTIIKFLLFLLIFFVLFPQVAAAQEEILEAVVEESLAEKVVTQAGQQSLYQKLKLAVVGGSLKGQEIVVEVGNLPLVGRPKYQPNDRVLVSYSRDLAGEKTFYIIEFVRRSALLKLFFLFLTLTLLVGRRRGLFSLLGLAVSFVIIFQFVLPQINQGQEPVAIAVVAALMMVPFTFYLSHGFNRKTTVAVLGTLVALLVTAFLAKFFIAAARLTGYASEEAGFLDVAKKGAINIQGLVLAGIIIGALGVLDDITIAQAAVVQQLKKVNPQMKLTELFSRALAIGQDHIASMVNTLVLVYAGAALPLFLLFVNSSQPALQVINYEIIAEEIIRTLVGSLGLITAVPATTFLACRLIKK